MNSILALSITAIIALSCFFDFKTRKIPNSLNLVIFITCLIMGAYFYQWSALLSFFSVSLILLPLYLLGVFGGGDFKLFCSLSFLIPSSLYFDLMVSTFIWAAMYSIIKVITIYNWELPYKFYGNWKRVLSSTKIPMTLPYLLAWLSLSMAGGWL